MTLCADPSHRTDVAIVLYIEVETLAYKVDAVKLMHHLE